MDNKKMVAKSTVNYRGITIIETESGCAFILHSKQYEFVSLEEATSCIDAMHAALLNILASVVLAE